MFGGVCACVCLVSLPAGHGFLWRRTGPGVCPLVGPAVGCCGRVSDCAHGWRVAALRRARTRRRRRARRYIVLLLLLRPAGFFRLVRQRVDTVLLGATLRVCMCTCLRVCAIWRATGPGHRPPRGSSASRARARAQGLRSCSGSQRSCPASRRCCTCERCLAAVPLPLRRLAHDLVGVTLPRARVRAYRAG